ncbi:MAG: PD-(D/E)XK nuclease family protein [Planctomycetes bacterium]|nr:PD-(D/E)XK nuclease family protein [Planctomycetota bacterium]
MRFDPFHAAVRRYADDGEVAALRVSLNVKLREIEKWRHRIRRRPIADVLWEIYIDTGYLAYVSGLKNGEQRRANLIQLHEQARKFGEFQRQGLLRFLQFLGSLRDAGQDLDAGSVSPPSGDVVRIMTIHRSKGLEFPVVFLGELGKRFNIRDAAGSILYDRKLGIALEAVDIEKRIVYPTLPHRLVAQANRFEAMAEDLRVLYVALTRAKQKLILVGTGDDRFILGSESPTPGPLPLLRRRRASSMLDWVFDAVEAQPRSAIGCSLESSSPCLFAAFHYSAEEMQSWQVEPAPLQAVEDKCRTIAGFLPLSVHAPAVDSLQIVQRRLTTPYAAAALTQVPAVVAASVLKRRWNTMTDEAEPVEVKVPTSKSEHSNSAADFRVPAFASVETSPTATRRGTLTHEFLQRIDLRRADGPAALKAQLAEMIASEVFANDDAASIDLDAVAWFFDTELGRTLRLPETRIEREWPFVLGVAPSQYNPTAMAQTRDDVLLVRGIVDCLFDAGQGWEVLDYKTDRVNGPAVAERAALYKGQLDIYAAAIEAAFKVRSKTNWLIFLHPRVIVRI